MTATGANDARRVDPSAGRLPRLPMAAMVAALVVLLAGCGGVNAQTLVRRGCDDDEGRFGNQVGWVGRRSGVR